MSALYKIPSQDWNGLTDELIHRLAEFWISQKSAASHQFGDTHATHRRCRSRFVHSQREPSSSSPPAGQDIRQATSKISITTKPEPKRQGSRVGKRSKTPARSSSSNTAIYAARWMELSLNTFTGAAQKGQSLFGVFEFRQNAKSTTNRREPFLGDNPRAEAALDVSESWNNVVVALTSQLSFPQ